MAKLKFVMNLQVYFVEIIFNNYSLIIINI